MLSCAKLRHSISFVTQRLKTLVTLAFMSLATVNQHMNQTHNFLALHFTQPKSKLHCKLQEKLQRVTAP